MIRRPRLRGLLVIAPLALLPTFTLITGSGANPATWGTGQGNGKLAVSQDGEQGSRPLLPTAIPGHWKLVFNSSFNGHSLNTKVWRTGWFGVRKEITGPINAHEAACYNSGNVAFPRTGGMALTVTHTASVCSGVIRPYSGAMVSTNPHDGRASGGFQYRYGVLQAKIYVPGIGGLLADWASVATFGQVWPRDGEDDILEVLGGMACFHFHSPSYKRAGLGGCSALRPGWHTVAANWQRGRVTYYYDGVQVGAVVKDVTSAPMYVAVINTVSAKTPWVDLADTMRVAYVRVWQES